MRDAQLVGSPNLVDVLLLELGDGPVEILNGEAEVVHAFATIVQLLGEGGLAFDDFEELES